MKGDTPRKAAEETFNVWYIIDSQC